MNLVTNLKRFLYLPLANFLIRIYRFFATKSSQCFARIHRKLVRVLIRVTNTKKREENDMRYSSKIWNKMKKINLKSKVRPRFVGGTIVILLLITTSTFYILKEEEKKQKIFTQKQLVNAIENRNAVASKLIGTIKVKKIVEEKFAAEKEKSLALEKEVEEKGHQIKLTLDKLEREITARREAEARLLITMREKRNLEAELKKFTETTKPVELEKIVVKSVPSMVGEVLMINEEHGFIIVNLGKVNDLEFGDLLSVYRNGEFIGKVDVEMVYEKTAAAAILPEWQDVEFKENDEVRKM